MKNLSFFFVFCSMLLISCGQEVAPSTPMVPPIEIEVPTPISKTSKTPVVEKQAVSVNLGSGIQSSENNTWTSMTGLLWSGIISSGSIITFKQLLSDIQILPPNSQEFKEKRALLESRTNFAPFSDAYKKDLRKAIEAGEITVVQRLFNRNNHEITELITFNNSAKEISENNPFIAKFHDDRLSFIKDRSDLQSYYLFSDLVQEIKDFKGIFHEMKIWELRFIRTSGVKPNYTGTHSVYVVCSTFDEKEKSPTQSYSGEYYVNERDACSIVIHEFASKKNIPVFVGEWLWNGWFWAIFSPSFTYNNGLIAGGFVYPYPIDAYSGTLTNMGRFPGEFRFNGDTWNSVQDWEKKWESSFVVFTLGDSLLDIMDWPGGSEVSPNPLFWYSIWSPEGVNKFYTPYYSLESDLARLKLKKAFKEWEPTIREYDSIFAEEASKSKDFELFHVQYWLKGGSSGPNFNEPSKFTKKERWKPIFVWKNVNPKKVRLSYEIDQNVGNIYHQVFSVKYEEEIFFLAYDLIKGKIAKVEWPKEFIGYGVNGDISFSDIKINPNELEYEESIEF